MAEDVADDKYMWTMHKDAAFQEQFNSPEMKDLTANARDVAIQIQKSYNAGDKETRKAVHDFEKERLVGWDTSKSLSGDKLSKSTAWSLFYQAHQRYIGHELDEKKDIPEDRRKFLEGFHGLDMGGSKLFDFHSLIGSGKLKPKGID